MNTDKSKLLWIAVIGLLVLNFSTLAFIWFQRPQHGHEPQRGNVTGFLIHELNLTNEQVKKFDELKKNHHEQVEKIQHDIRDMHNAFFKLMKVDVVDSAKVRSTAEIMSMQQQEIELVTFNHFLEIRNLCDDQQKIKFDDAIDEALQMMAPKPPRPPGPPGPPKPPVR